MKEEMTLSSELKAICDRHENVDFRKEFNIFIALLFNILCSLKLGRHPQEIGRALRLKIQELDAQILQETITDDESKSLWKDCANIIKTELFPMPTIEAVDKVLSRFLSQRTQTSTPASTA